MANTPGRKNPFTPMLRVAIDQALRQAMFCLPGRITAFDPATQLAQVECGIQRVVDGRGETIPVIGNVPVQFAGDNEWYLYHQITPGKTEGLIHFSQRAIDTWLDQGGPVAPHELRILSEEDAFFVPGLRSKPGAIPNLPTTGAGITNYDGTVAIRLEDGRVVIERDGEDLGAVLDEVSGIIDSTLSQLSSESVIIPSGSSAGTYPLTGQAQYGTIASDLAAIRDRLNTILGVG